LKNRKICIITGSRAEYGLLFWLMKEIDSDDLLDLQIIVTGMHLEEKFGYTYKQIEKDGFKIDVKVNIELHSDTDAAITNSTGLGVKGFGEAYNKINPDIVVILGDRFEILSAVIAAILFRIPIAHIHGGEVTEGAYDDSIRHAITKMSNLHFVAHEQYAKRVIQMGESPENVFNYGAIGLDNIKNLPLLNINDLKNELGITFTKNNTAIVTFHPLTVEKNSAERQVNNLLDSLKRSKLHVIFTMPNADQENQIIFKSIKKYVNYNSKIAKVFTSLGSLNYLSLLKYCDLMIGNSSSGIIEAPSFKLPVVNIGTRQTGRIKAENIIDCNEDKESIYQAICIALSSDFKNSIAKVRNPYGTGKTSKRIKKILKTIKLLELKKKFIDLEWIQ
jgi:UDP-N-acetylglucosamine 2-epimerase (non-hydrolysing)/GDP/UDP-N,N'-diacetylbacillosamine 2-epimerase (hydrolysing)